MKECVFAGTFDPITNGHMDIIERASKLFDIVHVAIMDNVKKEPMFSLSERLEHLQEATKKILNVKAYYHSGLLVEFLNKLKVYTLIRGVRNSTDFDYERLQENINRHLSSKIEVVYLGSSFDTLHISSSMIRELIRHDIDISPYVPYNVKKV